MLFKNLYIIFMTIIFITLMPLLSLADDGRLANCMSYKSQIEEILISEDVSIDYFYLAVCESGCKIKISNKGAHGFFQIMPFTFNAFCDNNCTDIDDIKCNTIAAARYIKHLQERFKKMHILIKAYNRGGTNFKRYGSTKEADKLSACVMNYIKNK